MGRDMGEIFSVAPGGVHLGTGTCAWHCIHFSTAPVEHGTCAWHRSHPTVVQLVTRTCA